MITIHELNIVESDETTNTVWLVVLPDGTILDYANHEQAVQSKELWQQSLEEVAA